MQIEVFLNRSCVHDHIAARFYQEDLLKYVALDFFGGVADPEPGYYNEYSLPTSNYVVLNAETHLVNLREYLNQHYSGPETFNLGSNNCADAVTNALIFCNIPLRDYLHTWSCARICCCCIPWCAANPTALFDALKRYVAERAIDQTTPPHRAAYQCATLVDHFPKMDMAFMEAYAPLPIRMM